MANFIPDGVTRALVITAHPDDVDFGAGGTIAALTDNGVEVRYCICTDGDAGGFDDATDRSEIPGIRRAEQVAAAAQCGVTDVTFLGYRDGYLEPTQDVQRDLVRVMRTFKPLSSPVARFANLMRFGKSTLSMSPLTGSLTW